MLFGRMPPPEGAATVWVVFDHPRDYPNHWVVRRQFVKAPPGWLVAPPGAVIGEDPCVCNELVCSLFDTIEDARAAMEPGLSRVDRQPDDDPVIAEVWV